MGMEYSAQFIDEMLQMLARAKNQMLAKQVFKDPENFRKILRMYLPSFRGFI